MSTHEDIERALVALRSCRSSLLTARRMALALAAGLCWLYATVQPPDALVERRGARLTAKDRVLRFVPISAAGTPRIVVDVATVHWGLNAASPPLNALPRDELAGLAAQLGQLNIPITAQHYHGVTGTIVLDTPAHPSLIQAVARFDRGCPHHHTQVCEAPTRDGGWSCTWRADGHRSAIWPHLDAEGHR